MGIKEARNSRNLKEVGHLFTETVKRRLWMKTFDILGRSLPGKVPRNRALNLKPGQSESQWSRENHLWKFRFIGSSSASCSLAMYAPQARSQLNTALCRAIMNALETLPVHDLEKLVISVSKKRPSLIRHDQSANADDRATDSDACDRREHDSDTGDQRERDDRDEGDGHVHGDGDENVNDEDTEKTRSLEFLERVVETVSSEGGIRCTEYAKAEVSSRDSEHFISGELCRMIASV